MLERQALRIIETTIKNLGAMRILTVCLLTLLAIPGEGQAQDLDFGSDSLLFGEEFDLGEDFDFDLGDDTESATPDAEADTGEEDLDDWLNFDIESDEEAVSSEADLMRKRRRLS